LSKSCTAGFSVQLRLLKHRAMACHGVISVGFAPESPVEPSWRLRRLQFPTAPATAPLDLGGALQGFGEGFYDLDLFHILIT
jgi:hypothetical protein